MSASPGPLPLALLSLTTLDLVVLGLCALLALRGALKGFAWQAVRLIALFGALWGAGAWYGWVADRLRGWFDVLPDKSVPFIAWGAVFVLLLLLGSYFAHMARGLVKSAELSGLDRVAGLVLGAAQGLALATLLMLVGAAGLNEFKQRHVLEDALKGSITPPYMVRASEILEPLLPSGVRDLWGELRRTVPN